MKRPTILFVAGVASTSLACVMPIALREPTQGRLLRSADGAAIAGAEVRVESGDLWEMRRRAGRRVLETYVTQTDDQGRWRAPAHYRLALFLPVPEGPAYSTDYTFRAPDGTTLEAPGAPGSTTQAEGPLRAVLERPGPEFVILPALGLAGGGGLSASAHGGVVLFLSSASFSVGTRAAVELGVTGSAAAAGVVFSPFTAVRPILAVELNARWLAPWSRAFGGTWKRGGELAIDLLLWRVAWSVLAEDLGAPRAEWSSFVSLGWGYF